MNLREATRGEDGMDLRNFHIRRIYHFIAPFRTGGDSDLGESGVRDVQTEVMPRPDKSIAVQCISRLKKRGSNDQGN